MEQVILSYYRTYNALEKRNIENTTKKIVKTCIIIAGIICVNSFIFNDSHFAHAQEYLQMPIRVQHSPTICAIEPQPDQKFPTIGKQLLDETEYAVIDWNTKLNTGLGRHPVWDIALVKIPLEQQKGFDYTKCDITIHYLPTPQNKDLEFVAAGITIPNFETGKTNIEIYYWGIKTDQVYHRLGQDQEHVYYTYDTDISYTGFAASTTHLALTIRHEIGHSLGLGHYVIAQDRLEKIISGTEDMPSIMVDTMTMLGVPHYDITPLDTAEIKSIYGDGGFDHQSTTQQGHKRVQVLSMDKSEYQTDDRIKLSIDTSGFDNETFGEILVIDSDNHLVDGAGISKSNSTLYLNDKYQKNGEYVVELINPTNGDFDFTSFTVGTPVTLVPKVTQQVDVKPNDTQPVFVKPTVQIPTWIKNNAKWWHDGSIGDDDFVKGIQYMIKEGIIKIPDAQKVTASSTQIPHWIKGNAGLWASGEISEDDFVKGIQYLVSTGIINS